MYFSMNTWNEMRQGIFQYLYSAKISAEGTGKAAHKYHKFVQTQGSAAFINHFWIREEEIKEQFPLLVLCQEVCVDLGYFGILSPGHGGLERPHKLLHPGEVVEDEAGALVVDLELDWLGDVGAEEGELEAGGREDPQPVLHLRDILVLVSSFSVQLLDRLQNLSSKLLNTDLSLFLVAFTHHCSDLYTSCFALV